MLNRNDITFTKRIGNLIGRSNKSVNSVLQKVGADDVLHVVDLKNIPTTEKATFMNDVIQSAGSPTGIVFINN